MAVRLNSNQLELSAIQTVCSGNESLAALLLGNLIDNHFYMPATQDAWVRLRNLFRLEGRAPDFLSLSNDPVLSESSRKFLKNGASDDLLLKSQDAVKDCISQLNTYRKIRALSDRAKAIDEALQGDSIDVDTIIDESLEGLTNLKVLGDAESQIVRFGMGGDADDLVVQVLDGLEQHFIPTGFPVFDSVNYGLPLKSLVTIGGTSGGGKSTLAVQLLKNIASIGWPTALVSLEMSKEELTARILSNCSGRVNPAKILAGRTSDAERRQIAGGYKEWRNLLIEKESYYDIFCPDKAVTIEETLLTLKPRGYKVVVIDYISLLAGTSGEDQWRKLGEVAWFAKMWAKANDAVVILLAQVNEDGRLKYSQTVKEHSSCCWLFTADAKSREANIIEIEQVKARNQRMFNFMLRTDLEHMRVFDDSTMERRGEEDADEDRPF